MKKLSLIGLGKLGLPLATVFASKGIYTIGIDVDSSKIDGLNNNRLPFHETDLEDLFSSSRDHLHFTENFKDAINETDVSIILVNTPSDKGSKGFSNAYIKSSLTSLCLELRESNKDYHLIVISSTVMPTTCSNVILPLIEEVSGRKLNEGFGLCYIPDLVALGSIIKDFKNPDMLPVGQSDEKAGDIALEYYSEIIENEAPIQRMSVIDAEITKVSLNAYITMKISFANFIGNICDQLEDANSTNVTEALGKDRRISPYFIKAGLAFGGTCFPRDTWAFDEFSSQLGLNAVHVKAAEQINQMQHDVLYEKTVNLNRSKVAILGLGFKANTPVVVESPAMILAERLAENGYTVNLNDPLALEEAKLVLGAKANYFESVDKCLDASECCVIATPYVGFEDLKSHVGEEYPVLDCWHILKNN
jgi:UDPglucose 6-dehydrogenase